MPGLSSRQPVSGMYGIGRINIQFKPKPKRGFPIGAVLFLFTVLLFVMTFLFGQPWARYSVVLPCIRVALGTIGFVREWVNAPSVLQFAELRQPALVSRDSMGISVIEASSLEDAAFAQGYAHAVDHIIRMERDRRIGYGTLAEVEGGSALLSDRVARTLGLRAQSLRDWDKETTRARSILESYSAGVNAYLQSSRILPLELYLTGLTTIDPWTPADSLLLLRVQALTLHSSWEHKLMEDILRLNIGGDIAEEYIDVLAPSGPWSRGESDSALTGTAQSASASARVMEDGSVALDARVNTLSGVLHNYPVMDIKAGPSIHVSGASRPGIPLIFHGKSNAMAWSYLDDSAEVSERVTREESRSGHPKQVRRLPGSDVEEFTCQSVEGEEWCDVKTHVETIFVNDKAAYEHTEYVHSSVNGPVVNTVIPGLKMHSNLRITLQSELVSARFSIDRLIDINTAQDIAGSIVTESKTNAATHFGAFVVVQGSRIAVAFSNGSHIADLSSVNIARPGIIVEQQGESKCPIQGQSSDKLVSLFQLYLPYVDMDQFIESSKDAFGDVMEVMKSPSFEDSKNVFLALFSLQLKRVILDPISKDVPTRQYIDVASPSFLSGGAPFLETLESQMDWAGRILSKGDASAVVRHLGGMKKLMTRVVSDTINVGEAAYGPVKTWSASSSRLVYFTRPLQVNLNREVEFAPLFTSGPYPAPGSPGAPVEVATRHHRSSAQLGVGPLDNEGNTITSFIMSINTSSSGVGTLRAVSAPGQSSHIDSRFAYSMASEWAQCGLVDVGASSSGKRSVVASFEPLKQDSERSSEL